MSKEVKYNSDYVDGHMRSLKIEDDTLALRLGKDKAKVTGDLAVEGQIDVVKTDSIQSATVSKMVVESKRAIELNSANGNFHMLNNNTEFSPTGDSFSGMILGFTEIFDDNVSGEDTFQATTTSFVNLSLTQGGGEKYLKVDFVSPPSNKVLVKVHLPFCSNCDGTLHLGLATDTSATTLHEDFERRVWDVDETDSVGIYYQWVVHGGDHGWSAGESKTLYAMVKETTAGGRLFSGDGIANYGAWTMEAVALPTTIGDGS